jgi:8-oxo-dGTP pyrophosphatase MutT (NUDIX family)
VAKLGLRVAAKAVIEAEGGILVLHPSEIDNNRNWHIPGGIRDDVVEPLGGTAVREVLEETGIDLTGVPSRVFKVGEWPAVDQGEHVKILAVFFHFVLPSRPAIVLSHEHVNSAWLTPQNHHKYPTNPEVVEIIEELLAPSGKVG